jgi:xylulose-5-phosphate/fructose-6-phosphate phosphoketolase
MVVLDEMRRYHLAAAAVDRARRASAGADDLKAHCAEMLARHHAYTREQFEDLPEIRDWVWASMAP